MNGEENYPAAPAAPTAEKKGLAKDPALLAVVFLVSIPQQLKQEETAFEDPGERKDACRKKGEN